jgi:hypothetical protein
MGWAAFWAIFLQTHLVILPFFFSTVAKKPRSSFPFTQFIQSTGKQASKLANLQIILFN